MFSFFTKDKELEELAVDQEILKELAEIKDEVELKEEESEETAEAESKEENEENMVRSPDHWKYVEKIFHAFEALDFKAIIAEAEEKTDDKNKMTEAQRKKDEKTFQYVLETFRKCLAKGMESVGKDIFTMKSLGSKGTAITKKRFGDAQHIPFNGPMSLAFAIAIYLEFYRRSQKVKIVCGGYFTGTQEAVANAFNKSKRTEYKKKGERLERRVNEYMEKNVHFAEITKSIISKFQAKLLEPAKKVEAAKETEAKAEVTTPQLR